MSLKALSRSDDGLILFTGRTSAPPHSIMPRLRPRPFSQPRLRNFSRRLLLHIQHLLLAKNPLCPTPHRPLTLPRTTTTPPPQRQQQQQQHQHRLQLHPNVRHVSPTHGQRLRRLSLFGVVLSPLDGGPGASAGGGGVLWGCVY